VRLDALLAATPQVTAALTDPRWGATEISNVIHDSRAAAPGALFCCVPGAHVDGHDLAATAVGAGAVAIMAERSLSLGVPEVIVPSVRDAMGPVAAAFWGHPSSDLTVIGITGTSGKTTTAHLLAAVLEAHGWGTTVLGTLSGARTTPEAPELQAFLAGERDRHRQVIAMEVSSHALAMGRVRATQFAVAVFTNLSQDHLDFHHDLHDYFETKARLFTRDYCEVAVVNTDDEHGRELVRRNLVPTEGYSILDVDALAVSADRCSFRWRQAQVDLPLGGRFNVSNAIAAAATAAQLGVPVDVIAAGLGQARPVPGRFESIDEGQPFSVLVDYSHKPGALTGALDAARDAAQGGRVLVVFGAGGDRDATKRPLMGALAARMADRVVITSDNPRGEDPDAIIREIQAGIADSSNVSVQADRSLAIFEAFSEAVPGDVVLIAGKGHETVQVVGDKEYPFDDRVVARQVLCELREARRW
jgi:UDP-N-acetylmuramoyl-L-alanyl-D-glutamate--2,6-diaminopimelate ligase